MCQPSPMPLDQNLESLEKRIKELNERQLNSYFS